ncbi:MAG: T9SS type A sorting domain-containing protein [Melioribacteraceae bacterium]
MISNNKKKQVYLVILFSLFFSFSILSQPKYCILKADDFTYSASQSLGIDSVYLKYINYIKQKGIVSGLGIIAKNWDREDSLRSDHRPFIDQLKESRKFEFWNHGYIHSPTEFQGASYDSQFANMKKSQDVIKKNLDVTMHTFAAGWNNSDITTSAVLYNIEELKFWMNRDGLPAAPGVLVVSERSTIEWIIDGRRTPSIKNFKDGWKNSYSKKQILICQLHPHRYDNEAFVQLDSTISFLLSKNVEFILPYDYYLIKANGLIVDAGPDTTIGCSPETIIIGSNNTSVDANSYGWTTNNGHIVSGAKEKIATIDKPGTYKLTVKRTGSITITDAVIVATNCITSIEEEENLLRDFSMSIYPNPFNPTTTVSFTIPNDSKVKIDIYNSLGQKVSELLNGNKNSGVHLLKWNGIGFSSGTYFAKITAISLDKKEIYSDVKKLLLLK